MVQKIYVTYNQVHKLCQGASEQILKSKPELIIAIGGGGYVPARILRSFLKQPGSANIPIQAIGLSLYEELGTTTAHSSTTTQPTTTPGNEKPSTNDETANNNNNNNDNDDHKVEVPGKQVTRTQWLDLSSLEMANLIGKRVLIVDEVDDTRTTLEYAVRELNKDIQLAREKTGRTAERETEFSIFVLHNKDRVKKGRLPAEMSAERGRYIAAVTVGDEWICYPWEATDIDEHDRLAREQEAK